MNAFAQFLFRRRKELGLTQQNIADELNISNKAVSKWETGECYPETAQLTALADILGCTVDEMLRGAPAEAQASAPQAEPCERAQEQRMMPQEKKSRPWRGCFIAAAVMAVLGPVLFFLFLIAFGASYPASEWASGILITFLAIALLIFIIGLVFYFIHYSKET